MSDSSRDFFETLARVLLRCWICGFVLLAVTLLAALLMRDTIHGLHGSIFGLTSHEVDVIYYYWLGALKLLVLVLFFLPWLSIKFVLRT